MTPFEFCQAMNVPVRNETESAQFWESVDGVLMAGHWLNKKRQEIKRKKAVLAYQMASKLGCEVVV